MSITAYQRALTRREAEVLAALAAFKDEETLIYERGEAYLGLQRVSARLVFSLIRKMVISEDGNEAVEHYRINETGLEALREHWGLDSAKEAP